MLLPDDDFPIHQTPQPLAHAMGGHPNAYDRFWFNGFSEDRYFAVALGLYPNRGVIDGAFAVVEDGRQLSVFTSDELTLRRPEVGPIRIDIAEPFRVNSISVNAPDQGVFAELTYRSATSAIEEPRQTMFDGPRIFMDVTRATQLGNWTGWIETPRGRFSIDGMVGTKDRSWGIRPVGEPLPGAPTKRAPQLAFTWAPLMTTSGGLHVMSFDDETGRHLHHSAGLLPTADPARHVTGELEVTFEPDTRWLHSATAVIDGATYYLEPISRFHMRGAGYSHPQFGHGKWHGGAIVDSEDLDQSTMEPLDFHNIHVQHVVRVTGAASGLGVVEQLIIGPYQPAGVTSLLDGAPQR